MPCAYESHLQLIHQKSVKIDIERNPIIAILNSILFKIIIETNYLRLMKNNQSERKKSFMPLRINKRSFLGVLSLITQELFESISTKLKLKKPKEDEVLRYWLLTKLDLISKDKRKAVSKKAAEILKSLNK